MAALELTIQDGGGNEQTPPYPATDGHEIRIRYKGGWNDSMTFVMTELTIRKEDMPGGAYKIRAYGKRSGELSQVYAEADVFLSGDPVAAVFNQQPAQGNPEIAGPADLSASEGA